MEDEILDFFESGYEQNTKIVVLKYFNFEAEARIYAARLKEEGIKSFLSNSNTHTTIAFLSEGGIGLHIKEEDAAKASKVIQDLERAQRKVNGLEESFREADLDEINYQKELNEETSWMLQTTIIVLIMVIIYALLNGQRIGFLYIYI